MQLLYNTFFHWLMFAVKPTTDGSSVNELPCWIRESNISIKTIW